MKGTMKILIVLLVAITLTMSLQSVSFAAQLEPSNIVPNYTGDTSEILTMVNKIVGLLRNIAVIASVIILTILGIKYMLGSAEEKAGYQKSFVPLIVGIVVVLAATQIASLIFGMLS